MELTDEQRSLLNYWEYEMMDRKPRIMPVTPDNLFRVYPDGDFRHEQEEGDEWIPYYCDTCDTFHKFSRATNLERKDGVRTIEVMQCDQDGNWDIEMTWSDGDDDLYYEDVLHALHPHNYFYGWARYWQWMIYNDDDPLDEVLHTPCDRDESADFYVSSFVEFASHYVNLCEGRYQ